MEGEDPRPLALEEEIARAVPALDSLGESVAGQPRNAAVVKGHRHDFVGPAAEKGGGLVFGGSGRGGTRRGLFTSAKRQRKGFVCSSVDGVASPVSVPKVGGVW